MSGGQAARPGTTWLGMLLALVPGELLSTGALAGGSGMEVSRWLDHGDALELDLPGIGHITHQIM